MSLQKADLYIDIIFITQNKNVKNRKKKQYITKKSLNEQICIDCKKSKTYNKGGGV